ncbi:hypothetical protein BD779DRAFT_1671491 [Infundibulicybe gibba]|nr:hypothetical protein BD779DRAFT_1671491 [Infundibulicybe gibba]
MAPLVGTQEPASVVTLERYFLATDFIAGIGYGAQAILYCICSRYLWTQRKARRMNLFMLAYITLLFLMSSVQQEFPWGPWKYYGASLGDASTIVGQTAGVLLLFLSELFMVWRCWVIWYSVSRRAAYIAAFFPALMLVASFAASILYSAAVTHPESPIAGSHIAGWNLIYYTLMLSTNVIATGLILSRLIAHRRAVRKALATAHAGEYTSLISMLVESAAFYSIIGLGCLIVTGVPSSLVDYLVWTDGGMEANLGYLIIARLAHGRGWETNAISIHSKIVIRRGAPTREQVGDEGEGSDVASTY